MLLKKSRHFPYSGGQQPGGPGASLSAASSILHFLGGLEALGGGPSLPPPVQGFVS